MCLCVKEREIKRKCVCRFVCERVGFACGCVRA